MTFDFNKIEDRYNAENDTGKVTWVDYDLMLAIRFLAEKVEMLERKVAELESTVKK